MVLEKLKQNNVPLTLQANRWLENYLKNPPHTDWLWMHNRWKTLNKTYERLGLNHQKILEVPTQKKTRIFIRMPNWLGDVIMALPVLRALRASRPDAKITLFARSGYITLLQKFGVADEVLGIPAKKFESFQFFAQFKKDRPDFMIALTNSLRGDIEMWLTGCKQRAGLMRQGYWRPLINCGLKVSRKELRETHQAHVWEKLFKKLGLKTEVSYTPFDFADAKKTDAIGFVPGSANTPEKRYPASQWRELAQLLKKSVVLFGAPAEKMIGDEISQGLTNVTDKIGQTDLAGLAAEISKCSLVVGNDTGAMHLANALGVPTLVIYGPTSPTVTRPIFAAPYHQLKASQGAPIGSVTPAEVLEKIREIE